MSTSPIQSQLELLAPAGNMTCLHAAVRAGADAVYLGVEQFNARRGADNFTLESLQEACDYAHLRGVKIFLTVNTAVLPDEIHQVMELIRQAYRRGVDAFIVQDIGVAREMQRVLPQARLHISTQMNLHNKAGIAAAAALGAKRVTLARELSLGEIKELSDFAHELGLELESFAHGAICICYSGQCFMSALVGGRSANRGTCAQACRLPYALFNKAQRKPLDSPGEHLLSPKDLCSVEDLEALLDTGVDSLKIEGRMKSPEYVHAVVSIYRRVLNRIYESRGIPLKRSVEELCFESASAPESSCACGISANTCSCSDGSSSASCSDNSSSASCSCKSSGSSDHASEHSSSQDSHEPQSFVRSEELQELSEVFSRGFTPAYLKGRRGNEIMSYQRPNNRGVFIGRVTHVERGSVAIATNEKIAEGDVLEFWTGKGHFAQTVDKVSFNKRHELELSVSKRVNKGDRVFRVRSAKAAFTDSSLEPRIPVSCCAYIRQGAPLEISFTDSNGFVGRAFGPVVEAARTKALSEEDAIEHINRLGQTPYAIAHMHLELDEGVGLGFSTLHKTRAAALEDLTAKSLETYHERSLRRSAKPEAREQIHDTKYEVAVWATNPACARAAKRAGADIIYVPALNYKRGEAVVAGQLSSTVEQAGYPNKVRLALPVVEHEPVGKAREAKIEFNPWESVSANKPVFVDSLGALFRAHDLGAIPEIGPHLPVLNEWSLGVAADLGAQCVWLSPELALSQIKELGAFRIVPLGLTILGATEMMITEHCMLMSQGPCDQKCRECARRKSPHFLRDRKNYEMPVVTDLMGRSHLYNAVQLDICHLVPELMAAGVSKFMVDTTLMNVEETAQAVKRAVRARDIAVAGGNAVSKSEGTTTGLIFRGID